MNGSFFEVVRQVGARGRQGRASPKGCDLVALTTKPVGGKTVLLRKVVVELDQTVVAVANRGIGGEIIFRLCRQTADIARPDVRRQLVRDGTLRVAVRS